LVDVDAVKAAKFKVVVDGVNLLGELLSQIIGINGC
jgi:hypothetical protein